LGQFDELRNRFDVAICFENIEHILDDRKLVHDIAGCLKPGGQLLLTTPSYYYRAVAADGLGPFSRVEDGGHVRRGYTAAMLKELCAVEGLVVDEIGYCSGFFSQKVTAILYVVRPFILGWILVLPLRILPILFDAAISKIAGWPPYSICMVAYKPRFPSDAE
jgi:SAM-dependent methyltransferase